MKSSPAEQQRLLELTDIDMRLEEVRSRHARIVSGADLRAARQHLAQVTEQMMEARNSLDASKSNLRRAADDLELVEQRIARDRERLNTSSSVKDVDGISHELKSLEARKSILEEAELEIMEQVEKLTAEYDSALSIRETAERDLAQAESHSEEQLSQAVLLIDKLQSSREALVAQISTELLTIYNQRAARGVPVGTLSGRQCGACRIALTAAAFDDILAVPHDEVAFCPSCGAILVR